jgi:hypothetical protein
VGSLTWWVIVTFKSDVDGSYDRTIFDGGSATAGTAIRKKKINPESTTPNNVRGFIVREIPLDLIKVGTTRKDKY